MKFATSVTLLPPLLSTAGARLQHQQTPRFLLEDGQYSFNTDAAGAFQLVQGFATDDDKVVFSVGADEIGFKTGFVNIDGQVSTYGVVSIIFIIIMSTPLLDYKFQIQM